MIKLATTLGDLTIELFDDEAPISSENFRRYVEDGFYDGTIFHRVIPNFMVQGGGFDVDMSQRATRDPIRNEADNGLRNQRGTLAMARTNDIHSATAQFFINLVDNTFLDHGGRDFGYAVFGRVTDGMAVVDEMGAVATGNHAGHQNVPREAIEITAATIE